MIAQRGTFIKKDGEKRQMNFVRLENLPDGFVEKNTAGGVGPTLAEGQEIVWDLDASGFRVFNWETTVGDVVEFALPAKGETISDFSEKNLNNTKKS